MSSPFEVLLLLVSLLLSLHHSTADVGTATSYRPPYLPTACYGGDASQLPADNLFAAAGEGIWDNGAACGRWYRIRCLSSAVPLACAAGQPPVQVKIVSRAADTTNAAFVLSLSAFAAITNSSAGEIDRINVDFLHDSDGVMDPRRQLLRR